ncbi:hypothetical protein Tco_1428079 [Tanacetum coccineum]
MSSDTKLTKDEECESVDSTKYRDLVGSPKPTHLAAVIKRIFQYIKGTTHLRLWYPKGTGIETVVYADSDHAGDYVDQKSTSGSELQVASYSELSTLFQRVKHSELQVFEDSFLATCEKELCQFNFLPASYLLFSSELPPARMTLIMATTYCCIVGGKENGTEGAPHLGPERPRVYSDLSPEDKERTSSNTRNQATVQDGRVVVQNVQGRQNRGQGNNARGGGAAGYGGAQNRVGNANPGQARQIKCYNCNGEWGGIGRDLALNVDNEFQANNCDAFDSDVDEAPTTQTMFMANLLSVDLVYDEADLSYDSEIRLAMIVCVVGAASSSRLHLASLCGACLARGHQGGSLTQFKGGALDIC